MENNYETILENVTFEDKKGNVYGFRIVSNHNDKMKPHGLNFKIKDINDGTEVQLRIDPKTMTIKYKESEKDLKNKDQKKIYRKTVDSIGGYILYAEEELREYINDVIERKGNASDSDVKDKFEEFEKLPKSEQEKYIKAAKDDGEIKESSFFDNIDFI